MSYKLVNANDLTHVEGIHGMPCIYADLPNGLDGGYYDMSGRDDVDARDALICDMYKTLLLDVASGEPTTRYYVEQVEKRMKELGIEVRG